MKKLVIVNEKNKKFHFRNREVRTPVEIEVTDQELKTLTIAFKMADIQTYTIKSKEKTKKTDPIIDLENKEVLIEELDLEDTEEEKKSILEKLMMETNDETD